MGKDMTAVATVTELRQKFTGSDRLSELFHMVNRILPEDQVVLSVPPDTTAGDALKLMQEHGFSQLPDIHTLFERLISKQQSTA